MKKILILGVLLLSLVAPLAASAQFGDAITKLDNVAGSKGAGLNKDINTSVSTIIKGALSLVGTIFLVLSIYAGMLWMTASGNEDKVTKAKEIITQAIVGLAITLGAYAITAFVTTKLNTSTPQAGKSSADDCGTGGNCFNSADAKENGAKPISGTCPSGEACYKL